MTLLKLFNTGPANSPKDDAGGFNAQLESKGKDQPPSPPKDDGDIGSTEAATPEGSSSVSFPPFKFKAVLACLGTLVLAVLVAGGVGIFQYNRAPAVVRMEQQETLFVADNRAGKAGKEPSLVCDSPIKCGHTVTGKDKLSLLGDVVCTDDPDDADCAITVSGEDAELDCNDFMITSTSGSWKYGICVTNRAKAKNCHVGRFGYIAPFGRFEGAGIRIQNGGEVQDSVVMFNVVNGILVEGSQGSTTKISDTFVHDNEGTGITFEGETSSESSIQIEGVRSINNSGNGMVFSASTLNLRVKDSEASYNGVHGFYAASTAAGGSIDFEVEGFFNSRYNGFSGMYFSNFSPLEGEMKVKGVVNIYKNKYFGLYTGGGAVNVVVDKGGALNSCSNNQVGKSYEDIFNTGSGTFSGDGYTCVTKGGEGDKLPDCEKCPSCPSE